MAKPKWQKIWEVSDAPIFEMGHGTLFCLEKQKEIFGYTTKGMLLYAENEFLGAYYSKEDLEEAGKHGKKFFTNKHKYMHLLVQFNKKIEETKQDEINFINDFLEDNKLNYYLKLLKDLSLKQQETFAYFNVTNPQFTLGIEQDLKDYLKKQNIENVNEVITLLTYTSHNSSLQIEQIEFLTLLDQHWNEVKKLKEITPDSINDLFDFKKELDKHVKKYIFLSGNEGTDNWDYQYYARQIKDFVESKKNPSNELEKIKKTQIEAVKQQKAAIKKYMISKKYVQLAQVLAEVGHYRLELRISWSTYFRLIRKVLYKISRITLIPAYELMTLLPEEVDEKHFKDTTLIRQNALERYKAYLFIVKDKEYKSYFGSKAISKFKKEVPEDKNLNVGRLYGDPAFAGMVEGEAYCLSWNDENLNKKVTEMPNNVILIIGNTRPSLMPAIRKAKAIITDEGGITSHAAIVSRELKIPCLIGTQKATKLIKTGMKLKVDCNNGFVDII